MNKKTIIISTVLAFLLISGIGLALIGSNKNTLSDKVNEVVEDVPKKVINEEAKVKTEETLVVCTEENKNNTVSDVVVKKDDTKTENKEDKVNTNTSKPNSKPSVTTEKPSTGNGTTNKPSTGNSNNNNSNTNKPNNSGVNNNSNTNKPNNSGVNNKPSTPEKPVHTHIHTHTWKEVTTTVHHKEQGHYENVVVKEAWTETKPKYETQYRALCNTCNADITGNEPSHVKNHMLNGENGGYRNEPVKVQVGTETINHPAVTEKKWVIDKAAWTEKVVTGYKCSDCGATK